MLAIMSTNTVTAEEMIDFEVGGIHYSIARADIEKYPHSYLATAVKQEWRHVGKPVQIKRDGNLFRYVYGFLVSDHLPKNVVNGEDETLRAAIRSEADFLNLPELIQACDSKSIDPLDVGSAIEAFTTIRSYLNTVKRSRWGRSDTPTIELDYPGARASQLVKALKPVWVPSYLCRGKLNPFTVPADPIYGQNTVSSLDVQMMIAAAKPSPFGHGTETVLDPTVRNSLEIPAAELNLDALLPMLSVICKNVQRVYLKRCGDLGASILC